MGCFPPHLLNQQSLYVTLLQLSLWSTALSRVFAGEEFRQAQLDDRVDPGSAGHWCSTQCLKGLDGCVAAGSAGHWCSTQCTRSCFAKCLGTLSCGQPGNSRVARLLIWQLPTETKKTEGPSPLGLELEMPEPHPGSLQ